MEYSSHFEKEYRSAPYYINGSEWRDYQPAYKYGYDTYGQHRGRTFDDVESELERNWNASRADSRLASPPPPERVSGLAARLA